MHGSWLNIEETHQEVLGGAPAEVQVLEKGVRGPVGELFVDVWQSGPGSPGRRAVRAQQVPEGGRVCEIVSAGKLMVRSALGCGRLPKVSLKDQRQRNKAGGL